MSKTIEDVLGTLCSEVSLLSSNNTQKVFMLRPKRPAKLASDILIAHGFDAKIYDESDHCRLYFGNTANVADAGYKLSQAANYAESLHNVCSALESLCELQDVQPSDFSINLMNSGAQSQQITITLTKQTVSNVDTQPLPQNGDSRQFAAAPPPVGAQTRRAAQRKADLNIKNAGVPTIAKTHLMQEGPNKGKEKDAHWRWLYNNFFRYFTENAAPAISLIIFLLVITSIAILLKGFICPDFAVNTKNSPWYCNKENIQNFLRGDYFMPHKPQ